MAELIELQGDLLDYASDSCCIVHQCNCVSKGASGLAAAIFNKWPEFNIYSNPKTQTFRTPGNVIFTLPIVHLFGQVSTGSPEDYTVDSEIARLTYFLEGLKKLQDNLGIFNNITSVAFPKLIGCGLAGGDWNKYYQLIKMFTDSFKGENVYIVEKV